MHSIRCADRHSAAPPPYPVPAAARPAAPAADSAACENAPGAASPAAPEVPRAAVPAAPPQRGAGPLPPGGRLLTRADGWIIALGLITGLLLWVCAWRSESPGQEVLISAGGRLWARAPLAAPARYEVPGPRGLTVVAIQEGRVRILSSPCPEQRCIHSGSISRRGALLVCVPNRVVVRLTGTAASPYDLITE